MGVKRVVGTVILWVVAVPMLLLVVALVFVQQNDEVNADSTTTGTVTKHVTNGGLSATYLCWFRYTVDGREYRDADDCSHDDTPIGSTVRVNYAADKPEVGFLNGEKGWGDKATTVAQAGGVIAAIIGATVLFVWLGGRRKQAHR